ncbi:MAG: hypothetical protein EXS12_07395 [Phycisphaerales bacterium]|nr:hypothetical protein [Phycisphaerales bacterium]
MTTSCCAPEFESQISLYAVGAKILRKAIEGVAPQKLNTRIAPGTWSIQEVIVHMIDSDLAATHRMRRIAAEEMPLLVSYDENAFIARLPAEKTDIAEALDLFDANRQFTARWLRTLESSAFARSGIHTQRGKVTLGEILAIYTHHLDHHMVFIDGKRKALGV